MRHVPLGSVASIDRTSATDSDVKVLPYVGLEHVEKGSGQFIQGFEPSPEATLAGKYRFSSKHVLYGKLRPYLNKVVRPSFGGVCTTELLPLLPDESRLDRTYLWAFLLTSGFVKWASVNVSGANLPRLDPKLLAKYPIPLPPLAEQKYIATILAKADRLRRLRRYTLTLGDNFLQSVFLQMFGDPTTNPMEWDRGVVGEVVESSQYGTSEKNNSDGRGYPVLGMGNVTYSGTLDLSNLSHVDLSSADFRNLRLETSDIVFNRTNSTELVGKTAHWNLSMDAVLASYLVKLKLNNCVLPDYFTQLLNTRYYKVLFQLRCRKAVGQSNISPSYLMSFPMYVPDMRLQQRFERVVRRHKRVQIQQQEAVHQAEHLFQTLLHRAFTGEL